MKNLLLLNILLLSISTNLYALQIDIDNLNIEPPPQMNPVLEVDTNLNTIPSNEEISDLIDKGLLVPIDEEKVPNIELTEPIEKEEPQIVEEEEIITPTELIPNENNNEIVQPTFINNSPTVKANPELSAAISERLNNPYSYFSDSLINDFYACRDEEAAWINSKGLNANATDLISTIQLAKQYGLNSKDYSITTINTLKDELIGNYSNEKAAVLDMLLTDSYFKFVTHISKGKYDKVKFTPVNKLSSIREILVDQLDIALLLNDISGSINEAQPDNIHYWNLQSALTNWLKTNKIEYNTFSIPHYNKDSVLAYEAAANVLLYFNYLDTSSIKNDSLVVQSLMKFQRDNGLLDDGIIGKKTQSALETNNADRYNLIVLNLEKMRMDENIPAKHIWVNLPSYRLRYYINNQLADDHRAIIGATRSKTPLISSELQYFILNPYWNVPYSIATGEMLPKIKRDPGYLARNKFKVISGGSIVNPNKIDWYQYDRTNFPYRFRQEGGVENALGIVKFRFPNNSSIYFHDTQNKALFNKELRAFSHGCIRVEGPIDFAKFIVEEDNNVFNSDTIDYYVEKFERKQIDLNKPVPVFLKYFTVEGNEEGTAPIFYNNIYGRDKKLLKAIKKDTERLFL